MAINFPNSPSNGDIYGNFTYDTSIPGWRKTPENSASLPAGTIVQWPGATAPANWLLADGAAVSRTTYASLFAAIGVQYGSGDGSTTFNLPNLKGRVAVGLDASQSEFDVLGETGGAKTHTLTLSEIPSHTHASTLTSATVASSAHRHDFKVSMLDSGNYSPAGPNAGWGSGTGTAGAYRYSTGQWQGGILNGSVTANGENYNAASSRSLGRYDTTGDTAGPSETTTVGITNASAGSGGAHNNLQPYIVLNYIIKTSAGITSGDSELATRVGVVETQNNATPLGPNYVINGGFDWWQRGTSWTPSVASSYYGPDRWKITRNNSVLNYSASQSTAGVAGLQYALRLQRTVGTTQTDPLFIGYAWESKDVIRMQGKTMTFSFYGRAGANLSSAVGFYLAYGTGTDEQSFALLTGEVGLVSTSYTLTTTAQRYTVSFSVPATATSMRLNFNWNPAGTAGAADYFEITGVQLEEGAYATPFRRNASSIQAELAACQRYFIRYSAPAGYYDLVQGFQINTTRAAAYVPLPVPMRAWPSVSAFSAGLNWSDDIVSNQTITALSVVGNASMVGNVVKLYADWSASFGSAARPGVLRSATGAGSFDLSAEL